MTLTDRLKRLSFFSSAPAKSEPMPATGSSSTSTAAKAPQATETALKVRLSDARRGVWTDGPRQRVLVTGGAGYIGSHIVHVLQETRRFKVVSIDNHHNSHAGALARVCEIARAALPAGASADERASAEVDAHVADLTDPAAVRAVFAQYGPGGFWGVIHVAAYKAVGESVEQPLLYYQNNVGATITLCQVMTEFGCTRMVYSSSATVYGTPPDIPIPETTRLQADSPYGRSKVMCETVLEDLCNGKWLMKIYLALIDNGSAEPETWRAISLRYFKSATFHSVPTCVLICSQSRWCSSFR
jgi:UDP-glucose 4-epimerase